MSYAKFGAAESVPPTFAMSSSQRRGFITNDSGDMTWTGYGWQIEVSRTPMSPMSWKRGSQLTPTSRSPRESPSAIAKAFDTSAR